MDIPAIEALTRQIRSDILTMTTAAGSGHPTSSLSAVELAAVLFFKYFHFDTVHTKSFTNDRFILSKGHASPLLYALWKAAGVLSETDLSAYRKFDSALEGHPVPRFPYVDVATGSLGQGLAIGLGEALALLHSSGFAGRAGCEKMPSVFVLMGDGELAEGSVWEAARLASIRKVSNLIALADVNGLGQSQETAEKDNPDLYRRRFEAFGWATIIIDGHNLQEIDIALGKALDFAKGPSVILAKTIKGKGVSFLEGKSGWHGKVLSKTELSQALKELEPIDWSVKGNTVKPIATVSADTAIPKEKSEKSTASIYSSGQMISTREAFGHALASLGEQYPQIAVIDGDVQNSTYTELFAKAFPDHFIQCYIAEQTMVSMAVGLSVFGYIPVISTFASFLTRAFDQLRMGALSRARIVVNGSHAGVSIGADGPSQMGLEDMALFRLLPGSTVVYPADAVSTLKLTAEALKQETGITYIRTTRPATPVIYQESEAFPVGKSKLFASSITSQEKVTVVGAGITLYEALKAQKQLENEGISTDVLDCYSVKPIDEEALSKAMKTSVAIVVVEDHYPQGGLGDAVCEILCTLQGKTFKACLPARQGIYSHLAVRKVPMSGTTEELLRYEEIDAAGIVRAVKARIG